MLAFRAWWGLSEQPDTDASNALAAARSAVEEARVELEKASAFPYEFDMREFLSAFRDPREARELWDSLESLGFDAEAVEVARAR